MIAIWSTDYNTHISICTTITTALCTTFETAFDATVMSTDIASVCAAFGAAIDPTDYTAI